jgi:hypothetical protein
MRVGKSTPVSSEPSTVEEQLMQSLQKPGSEAERFSEVKQIFQNLSPADAKELYNQLKANNDPLSKQFNTKLNRFKNELLETLSPPSPRVVPSQIRLQVLAPSQPTESFSAKVLADEKKSEQNIMGNMKQRDLHQQLEEALQQKKK